MPCCTIDGACTEETPESCRFNGGSVVSGNLDCFDLPCLAGMCCALFPSDQNFGDCRDDFTQAGCEAQAGTFAGLGLMCSDNTFEPITSIKIEDIKSTPSIGPLGDTVFDMNVTLAGNPTFPIRVQGYIDISSCPPDVSCAAVSRRLDFRIDEAVDGEITIPEWNQCPPFTSYAEPWRFRVVDRHCVASNERPLLLRCEP
jgi:hypothetical protein